MKSWKKLAVAVAAGSIALVSSLARAEPGPSSGGKVEFEVLRQGKPFGHQHAVVTADGDRLIAETGADLHVEIGPLTVFRYAQSCRESWRGGRLETLRCVTTRNGKAATVTIEAKGDKLVATGPKGTAEFPADTHPTSWWTKPPVGARQLVNTETGAKLAVNVMRVGRETIDIGGRKVATEHLRVDGALPLELWYDDGGRWVRAAFKARGQAIDYRLKSALGEGPA